MVFRTFDGTVHNQVNTDKFLGLNIDENRSWNNDIEVIRKKLSKYFGGMMNSLKIHASNTILLMLYNSFILPYMNYGFISGEGSSY